MRSCAYCARLCATAVVVLGLTCARPAALGDEGQALLLNQQHEQLAAAMAQSDFGRPLLLQSRETDRLAEGLVYAVLDAPMERTLALAKPGRWCDVLMLHQNTRSCQVAGAQELRVLLGGRASLMRDTTGLALRFETQTQSDTRTGAPILHVRLSAERGPVGTRDFDIDVQAISLPGDRSFMRLRYSYGFGLAARLAMRAYLNTWGKEKVGFSREIGSGGEPGPLVRGLRGVMERNTMRYFLAIDVVLQTLDLPPSDVEQRLVRWFEATERHSPQLHELDRTQYLVLKRQQLGLDRP